MLRVTYVECYKSWRHPMMWGLLALAITLLSLLFYRLCLDYLQLAHAALQQQAQPHSLSSEVIKPLCSWTIIILAIILPIFTTQAFSQEFRHKTFFLYATLPLKARNIVLGKFLNLMIFVLTLMLILIMMLAPLGTQTVLDWGNISTGLFAVACLGASIISLGLFVSSLISQPLIAAGVTFLVCIFGLLLEWLNPFAIAGFNWASELSLLSHSYHLLNGILYSPDIIYYGIFISLNLGLTIYQVERKMVRL